MILIPVLYGNLKYPNGIEPKLIEIPCHFDRASIEACGRYSLHTEYSYGKRDFRNKALEKLSEIKLANYNGIPMLWFSQKWAAEFAEFILIVTEGLPEPEYIEIHPPFSDYADLSKFLNTYMVFEEKVRERYSHTKILLENRYGTRYKRGKFIVSTIEEILEFVEMCDYSKVDIGLALDIPQLISANRKYFNTFNHISHIMEKLKNVKDAIYAFHLWGKTDKGGAHGGNLELLFERKIDVKEFFLSELISIFSDNNPRYFLPEINTNSADLEKLINDLISYGATFL